MLCIRKTIGWTFACPILALLVSCSRNTRVHVTLTVLVSCSRKTLVHLTLTVLVSCSRKTLVYLILTLNQCYPDYDFSLLRAHHFRKEESQQGVESAVDSHLLEVSKVWQRTPGYGGEPFLDTLWSAIDEVCRFPFPHLFCPRVPSGRLI